MPTKIQTVLVMIMAATAIGNTSAAANLNLKSILNDLSSVNLYKQLYEYIGAVLNEGIPALNVAPLDPFYLNHTVQLQIPFDPEFPNYTNIDIQISGFNISDFSDFEVATAELSLDDMYANLELDDDDTFVQMYDIVSSATDLDGRLLQYNCSTMYAGMFETVKTAFKQLELNGTYLQVKLFDLHFSVHTTEEVLFLDDCTGDLDIAGVMFNNIANAFDYVAFKGIDDHIQYLSREYTTILNDIFALRNVTDDDSTESSKPANPKLDFSNNLPESDVRGEAVRRSVKRGSHQKSVHKPKDNSFTIKWNGISF